MHQVAIVGVGYWGPNIARSLEDTRRASIRWFCDADPRRLPPIQDKYPQARTTVDIEDALGDDEVTVVVISTPVGSHYQLARRSLLADKHVLVEKPLTKNSTEAADLIAIAERRQKTLMVGHVFEYNASIHYLKRLISSGELGEIRYLHFERTNLGPVRTDVNALWDLGSHDISILHYILDQYPHKTTAYGHVYLNSGIEDTVFAIFSFADNCMAHLHASWLHPRKVRQITVIGSKKMAIWDDQDYTAPIRIFDKRVEGKDQHPDTYFAYKTMVVNAGMYVPNISLNQPLKAECEHLLDCLEQRQTPQSDGYSGLRVVEVLEAATKSMKNNSHIVDIEFSHG